MNIIEEKQNAEKLNEIMTFHEFQKVGIDNYFKMGNYIYRLHRWADYYGDICNYSLEDITNAGKNSKDCICYTLHGKMEDISKLFDYNFDDMFFDIATDNFENVSVIKTRKKAINVFNPLTIKETYKPLEKAPEKWTLKHALRAIANLQIKDFKCDGIYTDDYAFDNDVNFQKKEIKNVASFLKKVIENKSGWKVYNDDDRININCYYFDNNSFIFSI